MEGHAGTGGALRRKVRRLDKAWGGLTGPLPEGLQRPKGSSGTDGYGEGRPAPVRFGPELEYQTINFSKWGWWFPLTILRPCSIYSRYAACPAGECGGDCVRRLGAVRNGTCPTERSDQRERLKRPQGVEGVSRGSVVRAEGMDHGGPPLRNCGVDDLKKTKEV